MARRPFRDAAPRPAAGRDELAGALALLVAVWTALALGGLFAIGTRRDVALIASFGLATGLCLVDAGARTALRRGRRRRAGLLAARPDARRLAGHPVRTLARSASLCLAGVALVPGLAWTAAGVARLAGLEPAVPHAVATSPVDWLASAILAPVFEEHLYRARLLPALAERAGRPRALIGTSLLFALPHLEPVSILGAALAGLVLGARWLATGRLADCVSLHAGMNAAWLLRAPGPGLVPDFGLGLGSDPGVGVGVGGHATSALVVWTFVGGALALALGSPWRPDGGPRHAGPIECRERRRGQR